MPVGTQFFNHPEHRLHHKDHSGIAPVTIVVNVLSGAYPVFAEVVDVNLYKTLAYRTSYNRMAEGRFKKLGYYCKYVNSHILSIFRAKIPLFLIYLYICKL